MVPEPLEPGIPSYHWLMGGSHDILGRGVRRITCYGKSDFPASRFSFGLLDFSWKIERDCLKGKPEMEYHGMP